MQRSALGLPTGVDRVEHAYATHLTLRAGGRLAFVAVDKLGRLRRLPPVETARFLAGTRAHWSGDAVTETLAALAEAVWRRSSPLVAPLGGERPLYLTMSHMHLHTPRRLRTILAMTGARLVTFIHDLIPIQFPEYARPGHAERHAERLAAVAAHAACIVVNSAATEEALAAALAAGPRRPPILVAHLGLDPPVRPIPPDRTGPYFLCIGTIEPRKNHLLLLHVWRRLVERHGARTPHLVLAGRRGWENENVLDLLDRSVAIRPFVSEQGRLADAALHGLLHGCQALLFPSFAEGFGLPMIEALAAGIPVICSDLPVLREVAGDRPLYLDPIDGPAWLGAVERLAWQTPPARAAAPWQPPTWEAHFDAVTQFLTEIAGS